MCCQHMCELGQILIYLYRDHVFLLEVPTSLFVVGFVII